jgi:hypothetical protein
MKNITTIALTILLLTAATVQTTFAAAARKCIVSGETLGGDNGPPVEITGPNGQKVLLCCKSCVKKFNANPGKYLAANKEKSPAKS